MVRKSMWVAFAALLAYAPGALAYQYEIVQSGTLTYASELFGEGSGEVRINYADAASEPTLTLFVTLTDGAEEEAISTGDEMDITVSLQNAQFAQNIRASDLKAITHKVGNRMGNGDMQYYPVGVVREDGGTAGTSSIELKLTATGPTWSQDDGNTNDTDIEIGITLPPLMALNPGKAVTASLTVDAGGGSGFIASDAVDADGDYRTMIHAGTHRPSAGVMYAAEAADMMGARARIPLVAFASALTFATGGGGSQRIDLAGGRTQFERRPPLPAQAYLATVTTGVPVLEGATAPPLQGDGNAFSIGNREDGDGDLVITVSGQFHPTGGDVWLDLNGNHQPDGGEALRLRDGIYSGRFKLNTVAGDARAVGATEEQERLREEGEATRSLIYRPNGTDALRPATYTSTFSVDFVTGTNADKAGGSSQDVELVTSYTVINPAATRDAYAIPPLGGSDRGNVRVKCEVAVACPVYLECDDAAGDSWFQRLEDLIPGRSTLRLTSADIATHLGLGEDGWEGRLSCQVMSTQDISVQLLTRSGDVLVNNTYIDN